MYERSPSDQKKTHTMVTALSFSSCSKFEIYEGKRRGLAQWCFPSIRGIWSSRLVATKTHRTRRGLTRWGEPSLFQITIKLETKTEQMGERLTESRRNRWKGNPNGGSPRQGAQKSFAINTSPFTIFVINFRQIINNIRLITNHVQPNPPFILPFVLVCVLEIAGQHLSN